jgi:hypothetical protein
MYYSRILLHFKRDSLSDDPRSAQKSLVLVPKTRRLETSIACYFGTTDGIRVHDISVVVNGT